MNDKQRTKHIAEMLKTAAEYLDEAARIGAAIEDTDSTISGKGVKTLLGPIPSDLRAWARDFDRWYGEN